MARHLVRLSWRSVAQSFSRRAQVASSAWAGLAVLLFGAVLVAVALRFSGEAADTTDRLLRGALVLVLAVGSFGTGALTHAADPLDERAVVFAGRTPGAASSGTLLASLLTPASLALLLLSAATVLTSMTEDAPWLQAAAVVLIWLVWWLAARLGVRVGRGVSGRRWGHEFAMLASYCLLLIAPPLVFWLLFLPWQDALDAAGEAVSGSIPWAPPASVLFVDTASSPLVSILPVVALVLLLGLLEFALGARAARRAMRAVSPGGATRLGLFRSATSSGPRAIALRIWLAWLRDGRYAVVLTTVILMPLVFVIPIAVGGLGLEWLSLLPVPVFAFLLGWALHNDTAYDSTALWIHVTSGMRGVVDRFGRAIPTLLLGVIVILLGGVVTGWFTSRELDAVVVIGVGLALLGTTAGGSSIMSAWRPYPVARPGESPFSQPLRSWGAALVAHPVAGLVEIALCAPAIWLGLLAVRDGDWALAWGVLGAGIGIGAVLAAAGLFIGGRVFTRRGWKLLEFAQSY
ncbi:hypothetical protein [Gulosibacter sp. 10]|uniref:hypothetical protein n=1 Tax=Gulosibacter sp. 10 TaxID=1255570 RepID=UPI00097EB9AB|nr:hypothetical protein [Gulosibacter sp. 10]SJM57148.1 putative integral membrane transport protein [Gulosibacter sp. 10]